MVILWIILGLVALGTIFAIFLLAQLALFKAPLVTTPQAVVKTICEAIPLTIHDVVYDLGCGDSSILIGIEQRIGCRCIGYDISPIAYIRSHMHLRKSASNVSMHLKNFFSEHIGDATVIFCFLIPSLMPKTAAFITSQCKPGTYIFSYGYSLPNIKKIRSISIPGVPSLLYLYQL